MNKHQGQAFAPNPNLCSTRTGDCTCNVAMLLALTVAVLTVAWVTSAAAQSHPPSDSAAFVVKIDETTIDHTKLVTSSDCILVLPDGRFHRERRKEALPNPTSSLDISESSLDSTQLQRLHNILKGEDINKLPGVCTAGVPDYSVLVWILQDEN